MGTVTLQWNPETFLRNRTEEALKAATSELATALAKQFTSPHWAWPDLTERHDGTLAGTLRDIVDTGALARSQQLPVRVSSLHWRISWTEPYAAAVFLGTVFKTRASSLPARNIAYGAFQTFNTAASFARHWR